MYARHRAVQVAVEALTHDLGHWCRTCALPSGIRQWVAVRYLDRMHLQVRAWCGECGGRDITIDA